MWSVSTVLWRSCVCVEVHRSRTLLCRTQDVNSAGRIGTERTVRVGEKKGRK